MERLQADGALVQLSERFTNSAAFGNLFREGMDLVEETAAYLDGAGRTEAKALDRAVSLTYATESMRLTTRLMQLASWLLLHRAVKEGEMTLSQANREKTKVKLTAADPGPADTIDKLPAQMTVVAISKPGGPEVLVPEQRPVPQPGPDEILVKVHAAGVNRPDVAQRSGAYPPPPGASDLPGLEIAGEVVAVGSNAKRHKVGDTVMSLVAGGGYAQYCIAQDAQAMSVPPALSIKEAGALPETLMTVWHNVFERGGLKAGETLLIHGGSSGIGTMAIQLAKAFGAKVFVTVGSQDKIDACLKLGADRAINYKTEDFVAVVKAETNNVGVNLILDMVAGEYVDRNYDAAAVDGRIVQIATLNGPKVSVNIAKVMVKRLTHTGSTLRPRTNADKAAMVAAIEAKVMPLLREGRIKPVMDSTFPLEKAADAHRRMETSAHIGKIVLEA